MAIRAGGVVGSALAFLLLRYFHTVGAYLVTITVLLVLLISLTSIRLRDLVVGVDAAFAKASHLLENKIRGLPRKRKRAKPVGAKAAGKEAHKLERKRKKAQKLRRKLDTIQAEVQMEEVQPPQIVKPRDLVPKEIDKIKPTVLPSGKEYQLPSLNLLHSPPKES